jgi:signal transduction histidine kinase/CheY-like chemotaxis protein
MVAAADPSGRPTLKLLAFRGFTAEAAAFWDEVHVRSQSTCGEALRTVGRVIVPDIEACASMAGSDDLAVLRGTGIRAVQTTPLLSRTGALLGMLSTHWRGPHQPTERDLRLFDILARLAADLIERKQSEDALRAADRAKNEFLAMLGHELRNPLGALMNAARVLERVDPSAAEATRARGVITRQLQHLTHLVDDLLDVSRVMFGKIQLVRRRLDLAELVEALVDGLRARGATASHDVTVTTHPAWIDADETRIEQVVTNLVENALKFTPPGGAIEITVGREARDAVLRVQDSGAGIPADALGRIFNLFIQHHGTLDRSPGGLGIGLTLVRRLVEFHEGTVDASSGGPGRGSRFTVRLPACEMPRPSAAATVARATPAPRRVLVIEDNDDARNSLEMLLRIDGHDVATAADGERGLSAAATSVPEIAFIDVGLPGVDGYEVARRLRADANGGGAYLVALTGYGQPEDQRRAAAAGFDVHLVKPVDGERLAALIARVPRRTS